MTTLAFLVHIDSERVVCFGEKNILNQNECNINALDIIKFHVNIIRVAVH